MLFGYAHRPLIIFGIMGFSYGIGLQYPGTRGVCLAWMGGLFLITGIVCCLLWHNYHNNYPE